MDATTLMELRSELARAASVYRRRPNGATGEALATAAEELERALSGQPTKNGKPIRVTFQYEGHRPTRRPYISVDSAMPLLREVLAHGARAVLSVRNEETGGHDNFELKTLIAMGYVSLAEHENSYGLEG